jgi:hypothetical protein
MELGVDFEYECLNSVYLQSNMSEIRGFVPNLFLIATSAIGSP